MQFGALSPPSDQLAVRLPMDRQLASAIKAVERDATKKPTKATRESEES